LRQRRRPGERRRRRPRCPRREARRREGASGSAGGSGPRRDAESPGERPSERASQLPGLRAWRAGQPAPTVEPRSTAPRRHGPTGQPGGRYGGANEVPFGQPRRRGRGTGRPPGLAAGGGARAPLGEHRSPGCARARADDGALSWTSRYPPPSSDPSSGPDEAAGVPADPHGSAWGSGSRRPGTCPRSIGARVHGAGRGMV
jgi:hypothetical protein